MIQGWGFIVNDDDDDDYFVKGVEFDDVNNIVGNVEDIVDVYVMMS